MYSKHSASLYIDAKILATAMSDDTFIKNATVDFNSLVSYFNNHVDKNDPFNSYMAILTPGIIGTVVGLFGFGWQYKLLAGAAASVLGLNINSIFESIKKEVYSVLKSKGSITKPEVENIVNTNVGDISQDVELGKQASLKIELRKASLFNQQIKTGSIISGFLASSILKRLLTLTFSAVLISLGVMVAGDAIKYMAGKPNAFEGTSAPTGSSAGDVQSQINELINKLFPEKPEGKRVVPSSEVWEEDVKNNKSSIENMVLRFAYESRDNLQNYESIIKGTTEFQEVVNEIERANFRMAGANVVIIPGDYHSKSQITNKFIGAVAEKVSKS